MNKQRKKELQGFEEVSKTKIQVDSLRTILKKYQAMMAYKDSGLKKTLQSTTD